MEIQYLMRFFTLLFLGIITTFTPVVAQDRREPAALAAAFEALRDNNWSDAVSRADTSGRFGRDIIEWHRLRAGRGSFTQYQAFLTDNRDWPGLPLLRKKGERSLTPQTDAETVIAYFSDQSPRTGYGALQLARAYTDQDKSGDAAAEIVRAWRTMTLTNSDMTAFLQRHKTLISPHHTERLDMLLWRGSLKGARRMLPHVSEDWQKLAQARIGLRRKDAGVDVLIKAVPATLQNHPGLAFERFYWRARKGFTDGAVSLLLERSTSAEALGEPAEWANRRRSLARQLMRQGDGVTAYRVASAHQLAEGSDFADLEWLSGYLALRYLNDPKTALAHFQSFRTAVVTPISLGRAGYWEGRAHTALKDTASAQEAYAFGAQYQTSFYGLLAAQAANLPMDPALTGAETFTDWNDASFMSSSVLGAALLLYRSGEEALAKRFLLHLSESLTRTEMGQLANLALTALDNPHIALKIAKKAARQGYILPRAYFPMHPLAKKELPVATELAMAIARRESEFNPSVSSGVGARGLMQLMPKTAKAVAAGLEIPYTSEERLDDWQFNARLGSTYLAELQEEFGKAPILVAVGYNAGPSRARSWVQVFGDPRSAGVDVVDWIEHIPFRETRNYVMRVAESLPVYRARLSGETPPLTFLKELKFGQKP